MALRTTAAKLSQKVASSATRAAKFRSKKTSTPSGVLKNADPDVSLVVEEMLMLQRKMQRDTDVAQVAGACLGLGTLVYFISQARS